MKKISISKKFITLFFLTLFFLFFVYPCFSMSFNKSSKTSGNADVNIMPENFLRTWDAVTIFFDKDVGPSTPSPEDNPEKYVIQTPKHPGAYSWIDKRTLQFKPAEPWPPLSEFKWEVLGKNFSISTLMAAPIKTIPTNNSKDEDPIYSITLMFPDPIDSSILSKIITIKLTPLPGGENKEPNILNSDQFNIKTLDRTIITGNAEYTIFLTNPIPEGTLCDVNIKLSLTDNKDEQFYSLKFETKKPFQITHFGSGDNLYPVTPDGVTYTKNQSIQCSGYNRFAEIKFSDIPSNIGDIEAKNLIRFDPPVKDLQFRASGYSLLVYGKFEDNSLYKLTLMPSPITDKKGRMLKINKPSELFLYFPKKENYLKWEVTQGIIERYGPQMVPVSGRGFTRADIRIYKINPMDRSFWPFPYESVSVNEEIRPQGPGEEPSQFNIANRYITGEEIAYQIKALASPDISEIIEIPIKNTNSAAKFGIDLKPYLEKINGKKAPGTYIVGIRKIDESTIREWIRIQSTDLSLTTVEEEDRVIFYVTSLSYNMPVLGAKILVEGFNYQNGNPAWIDIVSGTTDVNGAFSWKVPGNKNGRNYYVRRISVSKDNDFLVLDPTKQPEQFQDNHWKTPYQNWLQWCVQDISPRIEGEKDVCHIFPERPVYRPEEPVYLKGYFRKYKKGELSIPRGKGFLVISGPNDLEWRYPVEINDKGSFFYEFNEESLPTGEYSVLFEYNKRQCGTTYFKKEAYRIPKFEVKLNAPESIGLDSKFDVQLLASYYAGGVANGLPVRWRISQFPYTWVPLRQEGYFYSTDSRFSGEQTFRSSPLMERNENTNEIGAAKISIDTAIEPTSQPRSYVVEATVTGADDQTVSNTIRILGLPPFTLAMKLPRYIPNAKSIDPEILVLDPYGNPLSNKKINIVLTQRKWHSYLKASDFSQNPPKYVTDAVDEKIADKSFVSDENSKIINFPITESGVYIVQITAADNFGRSQSLSIDLFAGGSEPVTWRTPPAKVFKVTANKNEYTPGETASLILESPFQNAKCLAIIEAPDKKHQYEWVNIKNGSATFELLVQKNYMPKIPVHFVLMRGRLENVKPDSDSKFDLGKPTTLASTTWINVAPVQNKINVELNYPKKAQPSQEIEIEISLADYLKRPVSGEAVLWLVDQAVLALGKEQRLDPLKDFIIEHPCFISLKDTRNLCLGNFIFNEIPGGDMGDSEARLLIDKTTIRKDFKPVPYYNPDINIGDDGKAVLKVKLPDNLTNFKIRAKAVSGAEKFGFGIGHISVRLPVIVEPSLPRFIRPEDKFIATSIARIVEGEGGKGKAVMQVSGLKLDESSKKDIIIEKNKPCVVEFSASAPSPKYNEKGLLEPQSAKITAAVERLEDNAKDGYSVEIPIIPDREKVIERKIIEVNSMDKAIIPVISEEAREGSLKRNIFISNQPALIKMAAGIDYFMDYPHGCTEQRISAARVRIASKKFKNLLDMQYYNESEIDKYVKQTLEWIDSAVDSNGLISFWPGSNGYVFLTAWTVSFMVEAKNAGFDINNETFNTLINSLKMSLRSDYTHYITGESFAERCWALSGLADSGRIDSGYAAELFRKSNYLNLESSAQVAYAFYKVGDLPKIIEEALNKKMWDGIVIRLFEGKEIYGGLQKTAVSENGIILPSETRTIAQIIRALSAQKDFQKQKFQLLIDAIVSLGKDDGWGDTNSNSSALLALSEFISASDTKTEDKKEQKIDVKIGDETFEISLKGIKAIEKLESSNQGEIEITPKGELVTPFIVRVVSSYLPKLDGSKAESKANGFAISREILKVKNEGEPFEKIDLNKPGIEFKFNISDIIEEHIEVVVPKECNHVAVVIPIAAGMEPLNPNLLTSPKEAQPTGQLTMKPSYVAHMDDKMGFYYDILPKGTYHFYFRTRATIKGRFVQPPSYAELMYDRTFHGRSNGAIINISSN
ncbi:MAG: hypothetical protein HQK76_15860 [Desulfobacterales bacterium]|nr:hypothetical protein [Desulfobacterales bacterium]